MARGLHQLQADLGIHPLEQDVDRVLDDVMGDLQRQRGIGRLDSGVLGELAGQDVVQDLGLGDDITLLLAELDAAVVGRLVVLLVIHKAVRQALLDGCVGHGPQVLGIAVEYVVHDVLERPDLERIVEHVWGERSVADIEVPRFELRRDIGMDGRAPRVNAGGDDQQTCRETGDQ